MLTQISATISLGLAGEVAPETPLVILGEDFGLGCIAAIQKGRAEGEIDIPEAADTTQPRRTPWAGSSPSRHRPPEILASANLYAVAIAALSLSLALAVGVRSIWHKSGPK